MTVVLAVVLGLGVGCTGFAEEVQNDREAESEESVQTAVELYESMIAVFDEETAGVDQKMEEALTVVSHYEEVDHERRRRFVGQVVPMRGGIGVQITAEYQIENKDAEKGWEDQPREVVEGEAGPVELALARSVERRYHGGGGR